MNNNMDIGEIICESVDTIVTERLRTVNFDATITCTIVDDSEKELGAYVVTDGSTRFTAYTSDTKLKNNLLVYVTIPNNNYSELKMIVGKKTAESSNEPYIYNPPFDNFIKGSGNLAINIFDNFYGLTANSDYRPELKAEELPATILTIPIIDKLPTTEIPFTRIGLKANFKTLLPSNIVQGNYGLRIVPKTNNNESEPAALDCNDFYGNPYQFFNYMSLEQVFVIPSTWKQITEISLLFFQDNNFNLDLPEKIDEDLSWIKDSVGDSKLNDNNIFVSGIELYLGYDINDFDEDNFRIYSIDNEYTYSNTGETRTEKILKGEWVFIGENQENSEIISADDLPYDKNIYNPLKKNILLSNGKYINMYCWEKGKNAAGLMEYLGVRWYRQKYGAPKPDDYVDSGWEILDPADKANELYEFISPLELKVYLRTNNMEENYKCIVFDNLIFAQKELENKEKIENIEIYENIEHLEKPLQINSSISIVSNTINFVNSNYERTISANKQTLLAIITTDNEDGNYYYYNLLGDIGNTNYSSTPRTLELYYESAILNQNSKCKVIWTIPVLYTMFLATNFKILNKKLDEINNSEYREWINVLNLDQLKNPTLSSNVFYKRVTIDNSNMKAKELASNPFILTYLISLKYNQTLINNNIDCKLYYINDEIPYTASRKFNFGLGSTSGTEIVIQLQCNELEWDNEENVIGYHPIIKLGLGKQIFEIIPRIIVSNTRQELDIKDFEINYTWYGRTDNPKCFNSNTLPREDNTYFVQIEEAPELDEYIVLLMTMKYNEYSNLTAYLPFAFANKVDDVNYAEIPDGVFEIIYDSASGLPFTNAYNIPYLIDNVETNELLWDIYILENQEYINLKDSEEKSYYPSINISVSQNEEDKKILSTLVPSPFYVDTLKPTNIRAIREGKIIWSQPLLILKNKFPNSTINKWNGNLLVDEEKNTIMSAMMAAGTKDEWNRFSGVLMGAILGESEGSLALHGLYGYLAGEQSFAFKEDGTAFLGKNGFGRIEFDGGKGTIKSAGINFVKGNNIELEDRFSGEGMYMNLNTMDNFPTSLTLQSDEGKLITHLNPAGMTIYRDTYTDQTTDQTVLEIELFSADYEKILIPRLSVHEGILLRNTKIAPYIEEYYEDNASLSDLSTFILNATATYNLSKLLLDLIFEPEGENYKIKDEWGVVKCTNGLVIYPRNVKMTTSSVKAIMAMAKYVTPLNADINYNSTLRNNSINVILDDTTSKGDLFIFPARINLRAAAGMAIAPHLPAENTFYEAEESDAQLYILDTKRVKLSDLNLIKRSGIQMLGFLWLDFEQEEKE